MDEFVARLNIEHLQRKLTEETDENKLRLIARLLAEEQGKAGSDRSHQEHRTRRPRLLVAIPANGWDRPRSSPLFLRPPIRREFGDMETEARARNGPPRRPPPGRDQREPLKPVATPSCSRLGTARSTGIDLRRTSGEVAISCTLEIVAASMLLVGTGARRSPSSCRLRWRSGGRCGGRRRRR